jgi:leukotriene-A4 hydrolase
LKKTSFSFFVLGLNLIFLSACQGEATNDESSPKISGIVPEREAHSYSNVDEIRTKHLHLDLKVDFENKKMTGVVRHTMERLKDADTAIFDVNGLRVDHVTLGEKGKEIETNFIIGPSKKYIGSPLSVAVGKTETKVNIYYETTDSSEALDWMSPELTAGKKFPYLYTQGQAILTRTWIPAQCTPANRITYSADIEVDKELMAIMSAKNSNKKSPDGKYHFEMKQEIPVYLIALTVGNLEYRKLGVNSGVFSEPEMVDKCAWEFTEIPKMITAAEKLYGKYQWEQYDVVVLPYSFPFGGMENPRLTFANPTLIAGDKSAVSVIAHELAHSWSGNLVTNATWDDFWLNEGFTVYFENRIMEELYGKEKADMLALIEFQELQDELEEFRTNGQLQDTHLKLNLKDRNPDDGMTDIAYVKGCFFLKTLERDCGRDRFDKFLRTYFNDHAFQTITTEKFEKYLNAKLLKPNKIKFNTKEWLYGSGLPKNCYSISSPRFERIQSLADLFVKGKDIFAKPKKKRGKKQESILNRNSYTPQEWQAFIRKLPKKMSLDKLALLDSKLNLTAWGNCEVANEWYCLAIRSDYRQARPNIERFLMKVGRRKFLMPIYKALAENQESKSWAKAVYKNARVNYHSVTTNSIDEVLDFKP